MKRKNRSQLALLWLLLIAVMVSFVPSPSYAGVKTLDYTKDANEKCPKKEWVNEAVADKWWSGPVNAVLQASVDVGNNVFKSVAYGARRFMAVGLGLWLAIFILKVVGGMVESDPMENVSKIGGQMFRGLIATVLLMDSKYFFSYFFAPIIEVGAGFVDTNAAGLGKNVAVSGGGLQDAANALKMMADQIHEGAAQLKAGGTYLRCLGDIHEISVFGLELGSLPDPGVKFSGAGIRCAGMIFIAAFPFFILDAAFRMGVTAALCPLFIVAWVFQSTRDYTQKGLQALLNVAFTFMMVKIASLMAIRLVVGSSGLESLMKSDGDETAMKKVVCVYRSWAFDAESTCPKDVVDPSEIGNGNGFFVSIVCAIYGVFLMKEGANTLANYFASTSFSNDTAFKAAAGTANAALRAPANVMNAVHDTGKAAIGIGKGIGKGVKGAAAGIGRMRDNIFNAKNKRNGGKNSGSGSGGGAKAFSGGLARHQLNSKPPTPNAQRDAKTGDWVSTHKNKDGTSVETRMNDQGERLSVTKRNAAGQITSSDKFKNGIQSEHYEATYNSKGEKTSEYQTGPNGSTSRSFRDGQMTHERVENKAKGSVTETSYKDGQKTHQTISAGGAKIEMDFDKNGKLSQQTRTEKDGSKMTTSYKRGSDGKVLESTEIKTNADGSSERTEWQHDANGKRESGLRAVTNANGQEGAALFVDGNGQRPKNMPASAMYDAKSKTWTTSHTDKNGMNTKTVMDKTGARKSVTKTGSDGKVISQTQFKNGNPTSSS